jgi:xanthine dehydrogenase YagR molybdenum-binding subunit
LQRELSVRFNLPLENVRVISKLVGGSFGSKSIPWPHTFLAAAAARMVQRPVKLLLTREEMYWSIGYRAEVRQHVRLGADERGKIQALSVETRSRTSSFDQYYSPGLVHIPLMLWDVPAASAVYKVVPTDVSTPVVMRAPGECEASFALNTALDELAVQVGTDPLALHLLNYAEQNPHTGKPFSSKALKACLLKTAQAFGWQKRTAQPGSMREKDTLIGWGMATSVYPVYQSPAMAKVRLKQDGSVLVQVATHELGTGVHTVLAQTAAEALGVSLERVRVETGDTSLPPAAPSAGSRTTTSLTPAVYKAAGLVRQQLIAAATADEKSPLKGIKPTDIAAGNDALYQSGSPAKTDSFRAIMERGQIAFLDGLGQHLPAGLGPEALSQMASGTEAAQSQDEGPYSTYAFGAVMVEVRINAWTGMYQVSRVVGSYGIGRVMNPKTATSQIKGAIIMGLGMVRSEETLYDHRLGRIVNNNFADYHVPVQADTPAIEVHFVDETDRHIGPMGAKGAGEIGITGLAAAVVNAIYHATGKRIRELPITPEKLVL